MKKRIGTLAAFLLLLAGMLAGFGGIQAHAADQTNKISFNASNKITGTGRYVEPKRDGYDFLGWSTKANPTENDVDEEITREIRNQEDPFRNTWMNGRESGTDTQLYAVWKEQLTMLKPGMQGIGSLSDMVKREGSSVYDKYTEKSYEYAKDYADTSGTNIIHTVSTDDSAFPVYEWGDGKEFGWYSEASKVYMNPDSSGMFRDISGLLSVDLSNFDTSKVTTMNNMFRGCKYLGNPKYSLEGFDVSNFDTSNVTNMGAMFRDCSGLESLDVSKWNTSKVTDMGSMFWGCSGLASLDLSNWDTSNVTSMGSMFRNCSYLTSLDLSNWDTSKVTNMGNMFNNCTRLKTITMKNCSDATVSRIESALTDAGIRNNVTIVS